MSREDIGIEGYEPGTGYQSALAFSRGDVLLALGIVAYLAIMRLLREYLGNQAAWAVLGAVSGAALLALGTRATLNPERGEVGKTEKGARRIRVRGVVMIVIGGAVMTLSLGYILFLWEGW